MFANIMTGITFVVLFGLLLWGIINYHKHEAKIDADWEEWRTTRDAIPFRIRAINGETALVERYDGRQFAVKNPFEELDGTFGRWYPCVITDRGDAIEDYYPIIWRW